MNDNYMPMNFGSNSRYGTRQSLVPVNGSHPLLAGVNSFDGSFSYVGSSC